MACHLCGTKIGDMNGKKGDAKNKNKQPPELKADDFKVINRKNLKFGIPVLHLYIRFLTNVLNVSYKMPVEKWKVVRICILYTDEIRQKQP